MELSTAMSFTYISIGHKIVSDQFVNRSDCRTLFRKFISQRNFGDSALQSEQAMLFQKGMGRLHALVSVRSLRKTVFSRPSIA